MKAISWKAWLGALALVVLGAALGAVGTTYFGVKKLRERLNNPPDAVMTDRLLMRIQRNLSNELDLEPAERTRLEGTLKDSAKTLRTIRQQSMRDSRAELTRVIRQIAEELPPQKREAFRAHVARQMKWLNNAPRRDGPNAPPPRPGPERERPRPE